MAVGDLHVFPGFLTPILTQISFQSHRLLFSHASAEVRGENTPERKFASTRSRTHNHQVMSPTRSPMSQPGGGRTETLSYYIEHSSGDGSHHIPRLYLVEEYASDRCIIGSRPH